MTKTGCVTGVHGPHIFVLGDDGVSHFSPRAELAQGFHPYIGCRVTFTSHHPPGERSPHACQVQSAL
jgi:hypothetical protein